MLLNRNVITIRDEARQLERFAKQFLDLMVRRRACAVSNHEAPDAAILRDTRKARSSSDNGKAVAQG
jgi:hypothetical protein